MSTVVDRLESQGVETQADELPRKRWSTAEFDRLLTAGFLVEGDQTYLWDGEIIEPMSENPPHINALGSLFRILALRLPTAEFTINQNAPIALTEGFKPQPDLSILAGPRSAHRRRIARPTDVALLIEVADTSRSKDFGPFLRKYAEVGIPRYWIVDIHGRRIEACAGPYAPPGGTPTYRERRAFNLEESVPLILDRDGQAVDLGLIAVREVLEDSLEPTAEGGQP